MAAAIITPARLDLDSRMSSVCIALPPPSGHLLREAVEPRLAAGARRVAAEPRAERRVGEQALEQPGGDVSFGRRSPPSAPRIRCHSGLPSTKNTGRKNATQSVPMTP